MHMGGIHPVKTLLFIGDSITDSHRLFLDTPHGLGDGYVSMIQSHLSDRQYRILNRGHDGFTSTDILRCLERDCLSLKPDVITLLVGVNDIAVQLYGGVDRIPGEFETVFRQILSRIRAAMPDAFLILMEPFAFSRPREHLLFHPYILQESRIIRRLADRYRCAFLPLHEQMNSCNDPLGGSPFTTDGIHLSREGNRLLADQWLALAASLSLIDPAVLPG